MKVELKSLGGTFEAQRRNLHATVVRTILSLRLFQLYIWLTNAKDFLRVFTNS